jgi:hypothetical protein
MYAYQHYGIPSRTCNEPSWIAWILLIQYFFLAKRFLYSLLIAMFRSVLVHRSFFCEIEITFIVIVSLTGARVQNQSEKIWFYNRYAILVEYTERPRLPPPFIIISYTRKNFVRIHRFFCLHHHFLNISSTDPHCLSPMYPQVGNLFA